MKGFCWIVLDNSEKVASATKYTQFKKRVQTIPYLWLKCPVKLWGCIYQYTPYNGVPSPPPPVKCTASMLFLYSSSEPNKIPSLNRFKYKQLRKYKIKFQPQCKKGNHPYAIEWNFLLYSELWRLREFEGHSYKLTSPQAFFHTKRKIQVLIDHPQFVNPSNILWTLRPTHTLS